MSNTQPVILHTSPDGLLGCHGDGEPPFDASTSNQRIEFKPNILSVGWNNGSRVRVIMQGTNRSTYNELLRLPIEESMTVDTAGYYAPLVCQGVVDCDGLLPEQQ